LTGVGAGEVDLGKALDVLRGLTARLEEQRDDLRRVRAAAVDVAVVGVPDLLTDGERLERRGRDQGEERVGPPDPADDLAERWRIALRRLPELELLGAGRAQVPVQRLGRRPVELRVADEDLHGRRRDRTSAPQRLHGTCTGTARGVHIALAHSGLWVLR
jgi:hypothetical protein